MVDHRLYSKYDFRDLENMWLHMVLNVVQEFIETGETCDCRDCVLDLVALALNRLPPAYWVSGKYNAFTPPESFFENQDNLKKAREAVKSALEQVKKNPHHD